ncbi:MAG: iron-containing alcohol dehydrogenase [Pseudomonadota bacterium]
MSTFNVGGVPPMTFGVGVIAEIPDVVKNMGGGPVLIVADAMLAQLGVTQRVTQHLDARGIDHVLAAEIAGEPKDILVDDLSNRARKAGAKSVIAIGGGAAMDAGKLTAAIAPSGKPARTFALANEPLPATGLPAIAVPTTAGTGSEVTRTAIVSSPDGQKNWYWGEELMFAHAVLDPELTLSLPPHLTAWTGIDAVAHALEASTARTTNPAGLLFGTQALQTLADALPRAVADGSDIEARSQVLWGSTVAGLALHNCNTHMGHNISHALGSLAPIHHGLATGLALEISLPVLVDRPEGADNYARAARALGASSSAKDLPLAFTDLMRACGISRELPSTCDHVTAVALAAEMKNVANHGMSQNAASPITNDDLDALANAMMQLPQAASVA